MTKITKKQRAALKQIDKLASEKRRDLVLGVGSIGLIAVLIFVYNLFTYQLGLISDSNTIIRGILYAFGMVVAGYCGIKIMHASQKQRKIDGYRQATGISRETLEAWKRGEIEG